MNGDRIWRIIIIASCEPAAYPGLAEGSDEGDREKMRVPIGRFEQRIAKAEVVELLHAGESRVEAITENVSPRGARVITDSVCAPGKLLLLDAPNEHLNLQARVVYCQRVGENKFAVGLELNVRVETWQKPRQR